MKTEQEILWLREKFAGAVGRAAAFGQRDMAVMYEGMRAALSWALGEGEEDLGHLVADYKQHEERQSRRAAAQRN